MLDNQIQYSTAIAKVNRPTLKIKMNVGDGSKTLNRMHGLDALLLFFDSKRDNYILIKQPHQEGVAERKIEYNGSLKKENTKVKRDLIS